MQEDCQILAVQISIILRCWELVTKIQLLVSQFDLWPNMWQKQVVVWRCKLERSTLNWEIFSQSLYLWVETSSNYHECLENMRKTSSCVTSKHVNLTSISDISFNPVWSGSGFGVYKHMNSLISSHSSTKRCRYNMVNLLRSYLHFYFYTGIGNRKPHCFR